MAVFLFAVGLVALGAAAFRSRSRFLVFCLHFFPFVCLFAFLWISQDGTRSLQVRKLGYEFGKTTGDYRNPARAVTLGGSKENDDLLLQDLPQRAVRVLPSLQDSTFTIEIPASGILVERNGALLNQVELADESTIQVQGKEWIFHAGGARSRSMTSGDKKWNWPREEWHNSRVKNPTGTGLQEDLQKISSIAESLGVPVKSGAVLGVESMRLEWSRKPVQMNRVFLAGYDSTITVDNKPLPQKWTCSDGDLIQVYAVEESNGLLRAQRAASFVVRNGEMLSFLYPDPPTLGMRESLLRSSSAPLLLTTTSLPNSAFPAITYSEESNRFQNIVAFVQPVRGEQNANFVNRWKEQLFESLALDNPRFEVVTDNGSFIPASGDRIALGEEDRMLFTLGKVRFPWAMLVVALIFVFLRVFFYPPVFQSFENWGAILFVSMLDFFLTTRLLFAFRAASLYPFSQEAVPLALLALLMVPYLLFAAAMLMRSEWKRVHGVHFCVYTVLFAGIGGYLLPSYQLLLIPIAVIALAAAFFMKHPRSPLHAQLHLLESARQLRLEAWLGIVAVAGLVMQLAGAGEALRIAGIRLPLALFYHPLLLWLSARALMDLRRKLILREDLQLRSVLLSGARVLLVLAVFFLLSFLSSDFGFFLLFCIPIVFLLFSIAVLFLSEYELSLKLAGVLLAAPVLCVVLLFSSYGTISRILPDAYFNSRAVQRILLAVNPEALEETGLVSAEKQLGHQRMFLAYSRSGWSGAGYGKRAVSPALAATALNDNVPSVFLLNDFGAAGFAGVCIVLAAMAWFWYLASRGSGVALPLTLPLMISMGAMITWIYAALYMILANCGILLFTGKNVFLWGLNSTSDLFHSTLLLWLIVLPVMQASEEASRETAVEVVAPVEVMGEVV